MVTLKQGVPVTQNGPLLKVDNRLAPGRHQFRLEVIDEAGLVSEPATLMVIVSAPPVVRPVRRVTINPRIVTRATARRVTAPITIRKPKPPRR
ncbi:hypothetical protein [Novosphingobium beihaiensis]|uniref:Ig-like domain-containing protein n=1 Tax=Novosphingobium beihaiensis TaxID=2930389 RepID=A0ABT0BN75_9SPHN|nr:hypothetical protein [Novosphingobium beihaiensis]MCJ2186500.1 hypothetical protein [Novosphingobium beihaiensis]